MAYGRSTMVHMPSPISPQPLLVAPLRRMHFLELQRLLVEHRFSADAGELPRRHVREIRVVAQRFAVGRLALLAEVAAARLAAVQGIEREQFRELEVVGDAAGVFEALVQVVVRARYGYVVPELVAQLRNRLERATQARIRTRHADVVPHDAS